MTDPSQQSRIERRLTAIVAADIAGYSRMMGVDEAGTARALRDHRAAIDPVVASYGGRIVKTTGDGVLIEPKIYSVLRISAVLEAVKRKCWIERETGLNLAPSRSELAQMREGGGPIEMRQGI